MVDCLNAFESCRESGHGDAAEEKNKASSQPPPGRKQILDSDDEAELTPQRLRATGRGRAQDKTSRTPESKGRRSKHGEFVNLEICGMKLTFTELHGRKMYVPVEGQSLQLILEHIDLTAKVGAVCGPDIAAVWWALSNEALPVSPLPLREPDEASKAGTASSHVGNTELVESDEVDASPLQRP